MLWLTFRQFRSQAVAAGVVLVALGVAVLIVGSQALAGYHAAIKACGGSSDCGAALNDFVTKCQAMGQWLSAAVLVVPGLIGFFWGAPLVARELESGTFRLVWIQSVSRARWTLCKLGRLGLASMAVAGLCSLLVTWWSSPLDLAIGAGPFSNFDVRGIAPVGYAAFAFVLGVATGSLIRRTVPAMGATLAAFVAVRVAVTEWVRPHLMAPFTAHTSFTMNEPRRVQIGGHLPQGAWVVSESIVNRAGDAVGGGFGYLNLTAAVGTNGITIPGAGTCPNLRQTGAQPRPSVGVNDLVARCVNQLHLTNVVTYQPASRYWPFQIDETVLFLVAAVAISAGTLWWVRRRIG